MQRKSKESGASASKRAPVANSGERITLKKLAEHLHLSRTTVSLILNDGPETSRFPEETRRRVAETAKRLGYRPNFFARTLNRKPTYLFGVVAPDFGGGYEASLLSGFQRRLLNTGYRSLVSTHLWNQEILEQDIETLRERGVEGLFLINSTPSESPGIPVVTICTDRAPEWSTRISIDNAYGINKAIHHLVSLGHKEIAFIKGPKEGGDTEDRWNAVLATCSELGVRVDPDLTVQLERLEPVGTRRGDAGRIAAEILLGARKHFTALLVFNDISAIGAMTALREADRKIPEDISVVGFDDIEFASIANPALTTVRQPLNEMAATAAELLLRMLKGDVASKDIRFRPELVVRSSTCPTSLGSSKGVRRFKRPR